jgi:hypothetical protein
MNRYTHEPCRRRPELVLTVAYVFLGACLLTPMQAQAQLAITEVMSAAATNCGGVFVDAHPDWWELTNYGTNRIDLTGYRFWDADAVAFGDMNRLPSIGIAAGESIVFVREGSIPDVTAFKAWWGDTNLPSSLQVYVGGAHTYPGLEGEVFYTRPGFDGEGGDGVRLWDAQSNLVDEVFFDQAVLNKGITFISDPITGGFGALSEVDICGAFRADQCDDIGSPGFAPCGPIPMTMTLQPKSQETDEGSPVTFRAQATGLPRPSKYQWFHNGTPVASALATSDDMPRVVNYAGCGLAWKTPPHANDLVISNVQPRDAGQYQVVIANELEQLTSVIATLTVNTEPSSPRVECPPDVWWFPPIGGQRQTSLIVSEGQPAIFDVSVRAYPQPTFRWSWSPDGAHFEDLHETNRSLVLTGVSPEHAGIYRVCATNELGADYASGTLTVQPKPQLRITEAMALACHGTAWDWWELTNTGGEPVNVTGYRWNDTPGNVGGGPVITNAAVIRPGESVILLESRTRESFLQWWGPRNLPLNLQCIVYRANGLTERQGDMIRLWNHSAINDDDFIDSVAFSQPLQGTSFWFDQEFYLPSEFGVPSREGEAGAFRAANGCDVGSPGWTRWTPLPGFIDIRREDSGVRLWWRAQEASTNRLQFTRELASPPGASIWIDLGTFHTLCPADSVFPCGSFPGEVQTAFDPTPGADTQKFYRIVATDARNGPGQP